MSAVTEERSPKSVALDAFANSINSILFTCPPDSSQPNCKPLVEFPAPHPFLLAAVASPTSVALPRVAIVI